MQPFAVVRCTKAYPKKRLYFILPTALPCGAVGFARVIRSFLPSCKATRIKLLFLFP